MESIHIDNFLNLLKFLNENDFRSLLRVSKKLNELCFSEPVAKHIIMKYYGLDTFSTPRHFRETLKIALNSETFDQVCENGFFKRLDDCKYLNHNKFGFYSSMTLAVINNRSKTLEHLMSKRWRFRRFFMNDSFIKMASARGSHDILTVVLKNGWISNHNFWMHVKSDALFEQYLQSSVYPRWRQFNHYNKISSYRLLKLIEYEKCSLDDAFKKTTPQNIKQLLKDLPERFILTILQPAFDLPQKLIRKRLYDEYQEWMPRCISFGYDINQPSVQISNRIPFITTNIQMIVDIVSQPNYVISSAVFQKLIEHPGNCKLHIQIHKVLINRLKNNLDLLDFVPLEKVLRFDFKHASYWLREPNCLQNFLNSPRLAPLVNNDSYSDNLNKLTDLLKHIWIIFNSLKSNPNQIMNFMNYVGFTSGQAYLSNSKIQIMQFCAILFDPESFKQMKDNLLRLNPNYDTLFRNSFVSPCPVSEINNVDSLIKLLCYMKSNALNFFQLYQEAQTKEQKCWVILLYLKLQDPINIFDPLPPKSTVNNTKNTKKFIMMAHYWAHDITHRWLMDTHLKILDDFFFALDSLPSITSLD